MRLLFLVISCYSLSFVLPGYTEYCFALDGIATQRIWGAYVISGVGDMNVVTRLFDSKKKLKFASEKTTREGKVDLIVTESQMYELCFKSTDYDEKSVSFEFSQNELSQVVTPVNNDGFEPLSDDLSESSNLLGGVYRNLQFYEERERIHRDLTERTCDSILWSVLSKIAVLCTISITQLCVFKGIFNMDKIGV